MIEDKYISEAPLKETAKKPVGFRIKSGAVKKDHIADGAVTSVKLKDGAVTLPKLSSEVVDLTQEIKAVVEEGKPIISDLFQMEKKITNFFNALEIEASEDGDVAVFYDDSIFK